MESSSPESRQSPSPEPENTKVEIVVDRAAFTFGEQYLRARCGYFDETYPDISCPEVFRVVKHGDTYQLEPHLAYTSHGNLNNATVRPKAALSVFANFFKVICQDPEWDMIDDVLRPGAVAMMAKLAAEMKCSPSVKATIMGLALISAEHFKAGQGQNFVCETLKTTYYLRDEHLFSQTMQHVIALKPYLDGSLNHLPKIVQYILRAEHKRFQKKLAQTLDDVWKELNTILLAAFLDGVPPYRLLFSKFRDMVHDCLNTPTVEIDNFKASKTLKSLRESVGMGIFDGMRNSEEGDTLFRQLSNALPDIADFNHHFGLTYLVPPRPDIEPPWTFE